MFLVVKCTVKSAYNKDYNAIERNIAPGNELFFRPLTRNIIIVVQHLVTSVLNSMS